MRSNDCERKLKKRRRNSRMIWLMRGVKLRKRKHVFRLSRMLRLSNSRWSNSMTKNARNSCRRKSRESSKRKRMRREDSVLSNLLKRSVSRKKRRIVSAKKRMSVVDKMPSPEMRENARRESSVKMKSVLVV